VAGSKGAAPHERGRVLVGEIAHLRAPGKRRPQLPRAAKSHFGPKLDLGVVGGGEVATLSCLYIRSAAYR